MPPCLLGLGWAEQVLCSAWGLPDLFALVHRLVQDQVHRQCGPYVSCNAHLEVLVPGGGGFGYTQQARQHFGENALDGCPADGIA
ncbi:hypothetical protein WISP_73235 [Willisornis vidua]|uniref:Secreted protein n=1 Tax=Willisornis vidua TaxID=1566151 RepID=A0ABQ9D6Y1_9PASS|nr:hypothetical protein WISP_73235 [Willisornis vidua]